MWLPVIIVTALLLWLCINGRYRCIYIAIRTLPRDIKITALYYKVYNNGRIVSKEKLSVDDAFSAVAKRDPQKVVLYFEDEKWTFAQIQEFSYKVTRYFIKEGYVNGDTVALLMENCPEYPCIYLGLSRIGVITALINSNLLKDSLENSITVVKPKGLIVGSSCKGSIEEICSRLPNVKLYQLNRNEDKTVVLPNYVDLKEELHKHSGTPLENVPYKVNPTDPFIYIYTSGTTGLPKASVLTHLRYILGAKTFALVTDITQDDIVYNPLPLYHTAGGMLGLGQALVTGIPVVIRKKFSASNYFEDCVKYNATIAQYIGEMCRYILTNNSGRKIEKHNIKVMVGNGLNAHIWKVFAEEFKIPKIVEAYGATEGVSNFVNMDNKIGAVGYIPWFLRKFYTITLLRCDQSGQLIKDADGRYIECRVNENGVAVGKINPDKEVLRFDGYTDKNATEKKILCNVFKEGDMYFNSGDILRYDEYGYFYFVDRTGDTFRWKGENVSTNEVESIISSCAELTDVIVYGVEVPYTEGKAGMAAIMDANNTVDVKNLGNGLQCNLPGFAIPMFIRIMESIPLTGTFKLKKVDLRNEGYDLDKINDKIYFFDSKLRNYVRLTETIYKDIQNGALRL